MRIRILARGAAALALAFLSSSCYVTEQGFRYLSLRAKAIPLDRALADPLASPGLKLFLERASAVRSFALDALGLKRTKNYTRIVILEGDRLATVVQACAELSFDRWYWSYPIVGKLPYRGYFDPGEAEAEAVRLRKLGQDVIVRPVDAFSTLGWLSDPLFSFMATYGEAEIAELLIHEMTHATAFRKGNGSGSEQFNEELATFVGREGSLLYLASIHGQDAPELERAKRERADGRELAEWLRGTARELEAIYASGIAPDDKRKRKAEVIAARAAAFGEEYDGRFKTDAYRDFPMARLDNAYLDLYRLYEGESTLYEDYCRLVCGSDLERFVAEAARLAAAKGDPKAAMRDAIAAATAEGRR